MAITDVVIAEYPPAAFLAPLNGAQIVEQHKAAHILTPADPGVWSAVFVARRDPSAARPTRYLVTATIASGGLILASSHDGATPGAFVDQAFVAAGVETTVTLTMADEKLPVMYVINGNGSGPTNAVIRRIALLA